MIKTINKKKEAQKIHIYIEKLKIWNNVVSLVQKNSLIDIERRHIKDSIQISNFINFNEKIIDIGSGAGFPGIILSILGWQNVILCEKNYKKACFLNTIVRELKLSANVFCDNIYNFKQKNYVAVSRAYGSLAILLDIMNKKSFKKGVFNKGNTCIKEIENAKKKFDFEYEKFKSITDESGIIIVVQNVVRKDLK